ncbi:hypothetical protein ALT721_1090086 [Alteromonas alvinellae]
MAYKKPESALVVLYDQHYRVLLLQRQDDPTFWQSVTGALEEGELPLETAYREVCEEIGIDAKALARLWSPSNKEAVSLFVPSVP